MISAGTNVYSVFGAIETITVDDIDEEFILDYRWKEKNIIITIKKRFKYYLPTYLVFYFIVTLMGGIDTIYDLFPIKLLPLITSLILGNGFYYIRVEKMIPILATIRMMKYIFLSVILILLFMIIDAIFIESFGYSIDYLLGMK